MLMLKLACHMLVVCICHRYRNGMSICQQLLQHMKCNDCCWKMCDAASLLSRYSRPVNQSRLLRQCSE